jgi:hypothetical protein
MPNREEESELSSAPPFSVLASFLFCGFLLQLRVKFSL